MSGEARLQVTSVAGNIITVQAPARPAFSVVANPPLTTNLQNVIQRFDADVAATGVKYVAADHAVNTSPATFKPFIFYPGEGERTFQNVIFFDEGKDRTPGEVKVSKRHEEGHAKLWSKLAAAHASPYNLASPIVLCPRDWGRLMRHSERATMLIMRCWVMPILIRG